MPTITEQTPPETTQNFPVVGIGASAGGLDAFRKFIEMITNDSGMAYVFVQHLAPDHDSILPAILSKSTDLPVLEITDDINLAPNNIYIIPENKILTAFDGVLKLTPRDNLAKKNMPIDVFFNSLAEVHKSFAIGAVFSGSGFDGTEGLKMIKERGGITYAQDVETATFESMPQSAITSGAVDFILPPEDIPSHLLHVNHAYKVSHAYADDVHLPKEEIDVFKQILRVLKLRTGHDFSHYKQPTLRRRIARRMVSTKREDPIAYLSYLRSESDEQDALFNDILIPVSYFFRDSKIFDTLCENVFPELFRNKPANESIRFWVAGCSTGEEAYSLAICLHEFMSDKYPNRKVQIFASDISENVIAKARAAIYTKQELQNVSETRMQNYFTKTDGNFHIAKVIRDMCVFAVHNFLKDPPFARMDLVSCRNVLIYFDSFLQKRALTTFHYSLREGGAMFLGKSETASSVTDLFDPMVKNGKIYVRKKSIGLLTSRFEMPELATNNSIRTRGVMPQPRNEHDFQKLAFEILFNKYTPAGVIINEHRDIVHFHGDTGAFLMPSPGKPNYNILKMAREGLSFELRNALVKINEGAEHMISKNIAVKGQPYQISFEIIPLTSSAEAHSLVLFHKNDVPVEKKRTAAERNNADSERIRQLEAELNQLREDIRTVNEDQEAANEELQSANEELLSNSEELQSLNEELETSSEELQSNNEELITVNDELMDRQEQLISARLYAEAIVETIREPLVILDREMRIKSANGSFYKYFETNEADTLGRSFFDICSGQWNIADLRKQLESILPMKKRLEDFELIGNFESDDERIIILNARQIENGPYSEQLILMAFEDITDTRVGQLLRESEERFRDLSNTVPVLLWMTGPDKSCNFVNKSWIDYTGCSYESQLGEGWALGMHPEDIEHTLAAYLDAEMHKKELKVEYRMKRHDGEYRWISCSAIPRFTKDGEFIGYVGGCMDVQEQKNFSGSLEEKVSSRTQELKNSEAFLQSILNTTQNLIYVYDFEKEKVVFINQKSYDATGYTPEEHQNWMRGDLFTRQVHPDDVRSVKQHRQKIRQNPDGELETVEFRLKDKEGHWRHQLSRDLVFRRDEEGHPTHYIGVATDISEIRQANENLKFKNQELQYSNVELASFSSIASHDLKEPLRKIMLFSKLVIDAEADKVSEDSKNFLERVINSADRMQQLIDDLISYSRTSREKIKFVETDLNLLLEEVLEDLKEQIEQHKAIIEIPEMPIIPVLPSQIRQLFMNLINNSIKYSHGNVAPKIKITSEIAPSEEIAKLKGNPDISYFRFIVSDNGIGFPDEYKESIFEPFKRLHSKDEYSGTGIGLAICKKIMVNHKGTIIAESAIGQGSVFSIYIPDRRKS